MGSSVAAAEEYRQALEELTCNNKTQINLLTILADENHQFAHEIVNVIENHILKVPKEQKLPVMYVADSILKNVNKGIYKEEFRRNIITVFLHVFKEGDEKMRMSLYKLRQTWAAIFPRSKLYELDMKVQHEDNAWPIANPATVTTSSNVTAAPPPRGGSVHVNPKFINGQPKQQPAQTLTARNVPRKVVVDDGRHLKVEVVKREPASPPRQKQQFINNGRRDLLDNLLPNSVKNEPMDTSTLQHLPFNSKRKINDNMDPISHKRKSQGQDVKPVISIRTEPTIAPGAHAFVKAPPIAKPSPPLSQAAAQSGPLHVHGLSSTSSPFVPPFSTHAKAPLLPPPGSFSSQPPSFPPPVVTHSVHPGPSNLPPYPIHTSGGPPMFNSRGLLAPPNAASIYPPTNQPTNIPPVPSITASALPPPIPSTSNTPVLPPQPSATPKPPAVISHEQVKLEGIPANNRIFVDGKAHEVFYIEDTAVIERNGLPHRIYFAGTQRNVIIDGVVHPLEFGKSKTVLIDGEEHVIRFGAPSRELYMGDFPFKGAFGGPPIFATINSNRHEIRLGGPAPEVKIDPQPSFDLARFMKQIRQPAVKPKTEIKPDTDMSALLSKLVSSGLINTLKSKAAKENQPPIVPVRLNPTNASIPTSARIGKVERMAAPATTLADFSLNILKIRYDSVITALQEKKQQCTQCGLRLEQLKGDRYKRHLDWHVKKKLKLLENTSKSRQWYHTSEVWIRISDIDDDEDIENNEADVKEEVSVAIKDTESRICAACNEHFARVFDEEEDTWQMKDCIIKNGKTYHSGCVMDASIVAETSDTDEDSKPLLDIKDPKKMKTDSME